LNAATVDLSSILAIKSSILIPSSVVYAAAAFDGIAYKLSTVLILLFLFTLLSVLLALVVVVLMIDAGTAAAAAVFFLSIRELYR